MSIDWRSLSGRGRPLMTTKNAEWVVRRHFAAAFALLWGLRRPGGTDGKCCGGPYPNDWARIEICSGPRGWQHQPCSLLRSLRCRSCSTDAPRRARCITTPSRARRAAITRRRGRSGLAVCPRPAVTTTTPLSHRRKAPRQVAAYSSLSSRRRSIQHFSHPPRPIVIACHASCYGLLPIPTIVPCPFESEPHVS